MKTFTRDYRITGEYPHQFARYFGSMRPCVFDIESTGLDPARSKVCLTAMLTRTDTGVRITQFLAENHYEENRVLEATLDFFRAEGTDYLITFNGQAFDVPFFNKRLESTFTEGHLSMYNFDLYRLLNKGSDLRSHLSSLSQMSIENYYGIFSDRQDTITGRESIALFDEYSVTGNTTVEKIILTHNREDVLQLHRLMYLALNDIEDFDDAIAKLGFPVLGGKYTVRPHLSRSKSLLRITGDQCARPVSAAFFPDMDDPLTIVFNAATSSYEIDAPAGRLGNDYYIDTEKLGIDLSEDPDCVNGYLILGPRTINLIASLIVSMADERLLHASDI
ncbi:MAG: ribonuclease H-like domain-containing protein [Mogibacterium sp.]|nr:ribonuclease H-like domain-containing protein [Mogibacterium sp.]